MKCVAELALGTVDGSEAPRRENEAVPMIGRLGDADRVLTVAKGVDEVALLGQRPSQIGTR
jgi:hypothetical protein